MVGIGAKECVGDKRKNHGVHDELAVDGKADDDVEDHPCNCEPPRPVVAEEHEDAYEDC